MSHQAMSLDSRNGAVSGVPDQGSFGPNLECVEAEHLAGTRYVREVRSRDEQERPTRGTAQVLYLQGGRHQLCRLNEEYRRHS